MQENSFDGTDHNARVEFLESARQDLSTLYGNFIKRMIIDASDGKLPDILIDDNEREITRQYLLDGYIVSKDYLMFDCHMVRPTRFSRIERHKMETGNEEHISGIIIHEALDVIGIDKSAFFAMVNKWKESGWSRNHSFYKIMLNDKS